MDIDWRVMIKVTRSYSRQSSVSKVGVNVPMSSVHKRRPDGIDTALPCLPIVGRRGERGTGEGERVRGKGDIDCNYDCVDKMLHAYTYEQQEAKDRRIG